MTDHNPLPRCPYCGEHMGLECNTKNMYWYECYKCGATTPQEGAEQAAYEAAMNRWQEPNVPLALEELIEYGKNPSNAPAWYEYRGLSEVGCWIDVERIRDIDYDNLDDAYGIHWRCWLRKPTKKEMTTTPWESKRRTKNDD